MTPEERAAKCLIGETFQPNAQYEILKQRFAQALRDARNDALEEAAKIADGMMKRGEKELREEGGLPEMIGVMTNDEVWTGGLARYGIGKSIADHIRNLKSSEGET